MATRKTFNDDDDSIANSIPHTPVKRFACIANQCPMTGAIFGGGGGGMCAYHYATNSADWGRITRTLLDWAIVTDEINTCRRAHINPETATSPAVLEQLFRQAWARVEPGVGTWGEDLKPQPGKGGAMDNYGAWGLRLERFIGQRVVESIRHQIGRKAA